MSVSEYTTKNLILTSWVGISQTKSGLQPTNPIQNLLTENDPSNDLLSTEISHFHTPHHTPKIPDLLRPARQWLDSMAIQNPKQAHFICKAIPAQCPFAREIQVFGRTLLRIPPLCKLNPLYEELVGLRFRALCYLADKCGEDISVYC